MSRPSAADAGSGGVASYMRTGDVTKAEIIWALKTVMSHHSCQSGSNINDIFVCMFPDSEIARKFQLGATKVAYVVRFGLAKHFHAELLKTFHFSFRRVPQLSDTNWPDGLVHSLLG